MGLEDGVSDVRVVYEASPVADGRPLGLAAFAVTTYILSSHNAGWSPDVIWIGLGMFYGGLGQLIAGMWQFKRDCTFTATAFSTYGSFWMGLAFFYVLKLAHLLPDTLDAVEATGWFLLSFFVFNSYMLVASLTMCVVEVGVFALLELTLLTAFIGHLKGQPAGMSASWTMASGYIGVFTSASAWYYSFACLINSMTRKRLIPVGPPLLVFQNA